MDELPITLRRSTQIWWAFTWRMMLYGGLSAFLAGLAISVALPHGWMNSRAILWAFRATFWVLAVLFGIWIMWLTLTSTFSGFRIALIKLEPSDDSPETELDAGRDVPTAAGS
ncbi:hypothetical protein [Solimonas marina]|uniref:Uncharacterized protein n=1 Tax=Solimonas marina TaxID=2714601 RepID=A0A969W6B4_9GAMM|nr:hypothetical protein [Solimonas marina]NKF21207.1 hypothetical protein [Solimonas marina]